MYELDGLDPLIDLIYDAALRPELWGEVLARVGTAIGATSGSCLWFGRDGLELLRADVWNVAPDAVAEYQAHYLAFCPRYRASKVLELGTVYDDRDLRTSPEGKLKEYFDFMDRYELGVARIALAEKRHGLTIGMNFYNRRHDELSEQGTAILRQLSPHFRRACNIAQSMSDIGEKAALGEAWFRATTASLTLDAQARVVRANRAAERLLAAADGLEIRQGRLVAQAQSSRRTLDAEVARVLSAPSVAPDAAGDFILIARPSGAPPFALSVIPLPVEFTRERAIVTISPTRADVSVSAIQRAFALTFSEASIASGLCHGRSPEQIAIERAVSVHTIRTQLKTIYAKLGVNSKAELVARITSAALGVRL